jgi:BirA family biotin operon repressor/biotin-[acetyl-CoA-carboxylase] ligase
LSFVAALAAAGAISTIAPNCTVRLKWPNDVLAEGRKIAGILLESASGAGGDVEWLAIGIGINLAQHPADTEFPATSLPDLGYASPGPRDALGFLAGEFAKWYEAWRANGFSAIRDAWLARAAGLGTRIRARLQNEEMSGVFEGIDAQGALILREAADRVRLVAAGDVYFS